MPDPHDLLVPTVVVVLPVSQLLAGWLGLRLGGRLGCFAHAAALLIPPAASAALLALTLSIADTPCPPGDELPCGEGFVSLFLTGLICMGASFLVAIVAQAGVWAHLRQRQAAEARSDDRSAST